MFRLLMIVVTLAAASIARAESPYAAYTNGPPTSPDFFPICVWLQAPHNAAKYKAIGINTYIGLWDGPTEAQLAALEKLDLKVICEPRMAFKDRKSIIAWMHGDEPDNAQPLPKGAKGYGPPITPETIVADYQKIKADDPTRPVMLNLGQGVAYDNYIGRGVRRNKMEDYPKYVQGCDIVSFDIYPTTSDAKEVAGNLWYVPRGVERLRNWAGDKRVAWNCIETTRISNPNAKPTPAQVKTEVWMSLIAGSRGLVYFAHQFKPKFIEAGLLADAEMAAAVGEINRQVTVLAPALNAPPEPIQVTTPDDKVPVAATLRHAAGHTCVFAGAMRDVPTRATFEITGLKAGAKLEVIAEGRTITVTTDGRFEDDFKGYQVHLYREAN